MTFASAKHVNTSTLRSSSRTRLLKLSTNGFSHGLPGSMNAAPVRLNRYQYRKALEVISGPVGTPDELGVVPRPRTIRSSTSTTSEIPKRSCSMQTAGADATGSPVSPRHLAQRLVLQSVIGDDPLQPGVLRLELLSAA
jgi:hypothetical protein